MAGRRQLVRRRDLPRPGVRARPGGRRARAASPGPQHLAFHAGGEAEVEALAAQALLHGWSLLFGDRHPHAGGADHYAAYLEDAAGFEVELVASG